MNCRERNFSATNKKFWVTNVDVHGKDMFSDGTIWNQASPKSHQTDEIPVGKNPNNQNYIFILELPCLPPELYFLCINLAQTFLLQSHKRLCIIVIRRDPHIFKEFPSISFRQLHKSLQYEVTLGYLGKLLRVITNSLFMHTLWEFIAMIGIFQLENVVRIFFPDVSLHYQ